MGSVVLNQRIQIQCQECSGADLIMRFSGCRKVAQTKRSDKRSASWCELSTRTKTETRGLERPLPKSSRHSAACPKKHNFLCQNVLDIYTAEDSQYKSCTLIFTNM